ncbi:MAG TPA: ABC transporter ATP-binding protein [Gemmatimonadales bacterium]|nr:ABC transporter ATP-binding protein [Gemmatimonadales bacterium]
MIDVQGLTKSYADVLAVRDLSFAVRDGEILGLVGPNGAGKTTTLRCLVGVIRPSAGTIAVDGHDLATAPLEAKRRLAFIPDEPQLFEYLTVTEHLRFIARLYNVADAEARSAELVRELELTDKQDVFPDGLSRGMKQKLAIACGLLHHPTALVLDEPLTGLDPGAIRRMKDTIRAQAASGVAVLLSSHLLTLVEELCTRILVIHQGRAVAMGTIDEIKSSRPELAGKGLEDVFLALTARQP